VVAILGVLKAGAAYVPLDPAYPRERLDFMIADAGVEIVLTALDDLAGDDSGFASGATEQNAAYVIYTSGSTGRPKGVIVQHDHVLRLFDATEEWYRFGPADVWTLFHSVAFDFSVWEIFGALLYGGRLIVVPYWIARDTAAFHRLVCDEGVTVLNQTPSAFRHFIDAGESAGALRLVIFGGEALSASMLRGWLERHGEARPRLVNMYGITETTVHVTYRPLTSDDAARDANDIGAPISDLQLYILDERMRPVPAGSSGEIYVGGAGLARGYEGRPDLTAERFVPNPFARGERLYRTGDLGRARADGGIEYRGRTDHQVKIRGYRIELGEVESVLRADPRVRDAVVVQQEQALVAHVVGDGDAAALRSHARARLPEFAVPATFLFLAEFPLTANGKIDRKKLPAWKPTAGQEAYAAPAGEVEERLARIWCDVLHLDRVGRGDNFFALGGDSIVSMQIIARARQAGLRLKPRDVFQRQTIAELAQAVERERAAARDDVAVRGPAILTPVQRWFFEHELERPASFVQTMVLRFSGVDAPRLERAVAAVAARHDALRLRFRDGAQWHAEEPAAIPLRRADGDADVVAAALQNDIDLANGPIALAAVAGDALVLVIHHLVVDAVSWRVLIDELDAAYGGGVLPPRADSFQSWGEHLAAHVPARLSEAAYWRERLGRPVDRLRVDTDGENRWSGTRTARGTLSASETRALLRDLPARTGAQPAEALLAALSVALRPEQNAGSLLVEMEGHGREELFADVDVTRTVGWFTSIFPLRIDLGAASEPTTILGRVRDEVARVPARGIGWGILRYISDLGDELAALPQPEISFNYLGRFDPPASRAFTVDWAASGLRRVSDGRRRLLLEIDAWIAGEQLHLACTYQPALHRDESAQGIVDATLAATRELLAAQAPFSFAGAELTPEELALLEID
ncbi:MAG TPA: amino acid adenylation domain-containing protein, partial [Thermoanaerobaculia bacterium]|nr:amino acid adenylation domain-containing protein [Thermoanaerobaculia bacterium]